MKKITHPQLLSTPLPQPKSLDKLLSVILLPNYYSLYAEIRKYNSYLYEIKAGVSTQNTWQGGRIMYRGGGPDGTDYFITFDTKTNCETLCKSAMRVGFNSICRDCGGPGPADPRYFKCWDANSPSPLNGIRLQFASQQGTDQLDPNLPVQNVTDWRVCMRI